MYWVHFPDAPDGGFDWRPAMSWPAQSLAAAYRYARDRLAAYPWPCLLIRRADAPEGTGLLVD
jgi:hypothetical protein